MTSIFNILGSTCTSVNMYYKLSNSQEFVEFVSLVKDHGFDGYVKHSMTTIIKTFLYDSHSEVNYDGFEDGMTYDNPKQKFQEYLEELFLNVLSRLNTKRIMIGNNDTIHTFINEYVTNDDINQLLDGPIDIEKIHDAITLSIVESIMKIMSDFQIEKLFENNEENEMLFLGLVKICMAYFNKHAKESIEYNNDSDDDSDDGDIKSHESVNETPQLENSSKRNNDDKDNDDDDGDNVVQNKTKKQKN